MHDCIQSAINQNNYEITKVIGTAVLQDCIELYNILSGAVTSTIGLLTTHDDIKTMFN